MPDSLAQYPDWLVIAVGTVVAAAAIWITIKLLKIALWVLLVGVIAVGFSSAVWLLLH